MDLDKFERITVIQGARFATTEYKKNEANEPRFSFLGLHAFSEQQYEIRAFIKSARSVELVSPNGNIKFTNINGENKIINGEPEITFNGNRNNLYFIQDYSHTYEHGQNGYIA